VLVENLAEEIILAVEKGFLKEAGFLIVERSFLPLVIKYFE